MQINKIIKQSIKRLEREGKILTPDFYAEAFCKEAKLAGFEVDDCLHANKLSATLNKDLQKELANYRIQTLAELARFLIAKLNRTNQSKCSELLEAQLHFNRPVLKAIEKLHNQEASELAKKSLELLGGSPTATELEYFKQLWENFVANYDDTFLYTLQKLGNVDTKNLQKTIENLQVSKGETNEKFELKTIASILISSLTPSIASHVTNQMQQLNNALKTNPDMLTQKSVEQQIKQAIQARIALDKQSVKEMVESLGGVLDKLSTRLIQMIEKSDGSTSEIQNIKKELELYSKEGESNFQLTHKKLYTIAVAIEENTLAFKTNLQDHSKEIDGLKKRVIELEGELKKAKEEAKTDFLTKLYNKRSLDDFMQRFESEYTRYNKEYTVAMFDIDHFKNVNDTYGHDAGDIILRSFAAILKKMSRDIDVVGRFGGEEFMTLLCSTDNKGAIEYAQKVRKYIEKAKFMYKGKRIPITVSIGLASRSAQPSLEATVKQADDNLYKAKSGGRNQVGY